MKATTSTWFVGLFVGLVACSGGGGGGAPCASSGTTGTSAIGTSKQAVKTAYCTGNAASCGSFSGLGCTQPGCHVDIGAYDDPSDDRCRGYPESCSSRSSQSRCEDVKGCRWVEPDDDTSSAGSSGGGSSSGGQAAAAPAGQMCPDTEGSAPGTTGDPAPGAPGASTSPGSPADPTGDPGGPSTGGSSGGSSSGGSTSDAGGPSNPDPPEPPDSGAPQPPAPTPPGP